MAIIYDGTGWAALESPTPRDLYCCAFVDATKGYAGGKSGVLLRFKNGAWTEYGRSLTTKDINSMSISGNMGWAAGKAGTVLQFDGSEWFLSSAGTNTNLLGMYYNGNSGFCTGESGFASSFDDQAFTSPLAQMIHHVAGTEKSVIAENLLFGTTYYWRMLAKHSTDTSQWSGARSFTTLYSVSLSKPNDNATDQEMQVELLFLKSTTGR